MDIDESIEEHKSDCNKVSVEELDQEKRLDMPIVDGVLKITYENYKPYGIRDDGGFLFFFSSVNRYNEQEDRYKRELDRQHRLAEYLLNALREA